VLLKSRVSNTKGGRRILSDTLRRLVRKHGEISKLKGGKYKRIVWWSPKALAAYNNDSKTYRQLVAVHRRADVDGLVAKLLKAETRKNVEEIFKLDRPCVILRTEHAAFHKRGKRLPRLVGGPNTRTK
jgi:hypothetical protein